MGNVIKENYAARIQKKFSEHIIKPVTLRLFVQDKNQSGECEYCDQTEQMVHEIAALNDKIQVVVHLYPTEELEVGKYGIERVPALILENSEGEDTGVRFYGMPSGFELDTLVEDIVDISTGKVNLPANLISEIEQIKNDATIKVFTTPT